MFQPELFHPFEHHLAVAAALAGSVPCSYFPVSEAGRQAACLRVSRRVFLSADTDDQPPSNDMQCALASLVKSSLLPHPALAGGFVLFYPGEAWLEPLTEAVLQGCRVYPGRREHYVVNLAAEPAEPPQPPEGFSLRPVDAALLAETALENLPVLLEEMASERVSTADFLAHSFGSALVTHNRLAAWCLSEYNHDGRCEVGIATDERFRRQGLGTLVGRAFLAQAAARGLSEVGWDCWALNTASVATARALGFNLVSEYGCCFVEPEA